MEFSFLQCASLNAVKGSYSPVTDREIFDSQITATDSESKLLIEFFNRSGEGIYIGNVNSNKDAAKKRFRLFPSGDEIYLNLVYPKPNRTELRLYLSSRAGFMPRKGDVWFLFVSRDDGDLWIGSLPEPQWRVLNENKIEEQKQEEKKLADVQRDPALVRKRMELSKFKCEYSDAHRLFIAKASGNPYVEVHHVIPLNFRDSFEGKKLDHLNNLYSLCPYCHAAVHHAEGRIARKLLSKMYDERSIGFHYGISKLYLYQLYSVEEIVKNVDPLLSAIPEIEA